MIRLVSPQLALRWRSNGDQECIRHANRALAGLGRAAVTNQIPRGYLLCHLIPWSVSARPSTGAGRRGPVVYLPAVASSLGRRGAAPWCRSEPSWPSPDGSGRWDAIHRRSGPGNDQCVTRGVLSRPGSGARAGFLAREPGVGEVGRDYHAGDGTCMGRRDVEIAVSDIHLSGLPLVACLVCQALSLVDTAQVGSDGYLV